MSLLIALLFALLFISVLTVLFFSKRIIAWLKLHKKWGALLVTILVAAPTGALLYLGDEPIEPPILEDAKAYDYWYAPPNSMGISSMKTVNWTHFKELFLSHIDWNLEYKRYDHSEWTNGKQYMTIGRTWNESGFWKFNLIFDVPIDVYSARFTFGCNLSLLQYVKRSGYEVWLNYSANNTETYSCMFNWSDIASIPGLVITNGKTDNMFWFRFRRDNIPAGHYEFDPTFGQTSIVGSYAFNPGLDFCFVTQSKPINGDGYVKSISVYVDPANSADKLKGALYAYTDDSSAYAGALLAVTDEKSFSGSESAGWVTMNFTTNYQITNNTNYYIAAWCNDGSGAWNYYRVTGVAGKKSAYLALTYTGTFPNPLASEAGSSYTYLAYCTYTRSPTQSSPAPTNGSTGQSITPQCAITVADPDADLMTVRWYENSTGSWVLRQTNSSAANGTYRWVYTQASTGNTKYYWKVAANDTITNTSKWYYFTTLSVSHVPTNQLNNPRPNGTTGISIYPLCAIWANDTGSQKLNITWYENTTGSWVLRGKNSTVNPNAIYRFNFSQFKNSNTKYYFKVHVDDQTTNVSKWYYFTTVAAGAYSGPDYYVDGASGSDSNNGSLSHPFKTIQKAVNVSTNGNTIYVMKGTYMPSTGHIVIINKKASNTWLTLRNYNNDYVLINGTNCPTGYPSFTWNATIEIFNSKYIKVSGIHIDHSTRGGVSIWDDGTDCSFVTIDNCSITNCSTWAIKIVSGNNMVFEYNYVHDNMNNWSGVWASQEVLSFETITTFSISNNRIISNRAENIDLKGGCKNGIVSYNEINTSGAYVKKADGLNYWGGQAIFVDARGVSSNISIYNNLIYGNASAISIGNEGATGHLENISIYNNVINSTNYGGAATWNGRTAFLLTSMGSSTEMAKDIYFYSNTIYVENRISGGGSYDFPVVISGYTPSKLKRAYIVNNIIYTTQSSAGLQLVVIYNTDFADGIIILNNNSYYRPVNTIRIYWNGTTYVSGTNPEKFGGDPIFTDPQFADSANGELWVGSASPCIDSGSNVLVPSFDFNSSSRPSGAGYDMGAYEYPDANVYYNATIRTYGVDYFTWLGKNTSAYTVYKNLTGMNEATEYVAIFNNSGVWGKYYGDRTGWNFTIHTFDVVRTYMNDAVGNITFNMVSNPDIDYALHRTVNLKKVGNGYNYTGYTNSTATTLSGLNTTLTLATGYYVGLWNRTTFTWTYFISGFGTFDGISKAVARWDVIVTKIEANKTWVL